MTDDPTTPASPLPGFAQRSERRRWIDEQITEWSRGMKGEALVERVRHELGEDGVRVLRGRALARPPAPQGPASLFGGAPPEVPPPNDPFSRMAIDDLFAAAHDLNHLVPLLGFLGRAPDNIYNAMVVYVQNPNARDWRTRTAWREEKRTVKEGAKALLTLFPFGPFKIKYDVADTEGPPRNDGPGIFDAEGAVSTHHLAEVRTRLEREGIEVRETRPMETRASGCIRRRGSEFEIALEMRASPASQYGTLCHELAHLYLGHLGSDPRSHAKKGGERGEKARWPHRTSLPHAVEELEAEGVAFLLCAQIGVVTPAAEYIAGYIRRVPPGAAPGVEMMVRAASALSRLVWERE